MQNEKSPQTGGKKRKNTGKMPMTKTQKRVLVTVISVLLVLAIVAGVIIAVTVIGNRPPDLQSVRGRLEQLITDSGRINHILWGEGLPTYERVYSEPFSFKDVYDKDGANEEKNISGMILPTKEFGTVVAYKAWMFFVPEGDGEQNGLYYDFENNVQLSGKPDDAAYYNFALRCDVPREDMTVNAYLTENLGGDWYYYTLPEFDMNKILVYNDKDDPNYDYVKESSGFSYTDDIKAAAEKVYSEDFRNDFYETMFVGAAASPTTGMLYARYIDYEDTESGYVYLMKSNREQEKGYDLKEWAYDFSTMKMVKKSNAGFITIEVERYPVGEPEDRQTAKHTFALENGEWYLDSPTY